MPKDQTNVYFKSRKTEHRVSPKPGCLSFLSREILGRTAHFFSCFPFYIHHLLLVSKRQQTHTGESRSSGMLSPLLPPSPPSQPPSFSAFRQLLFLVWITFAFRYHWKYFLLMQKRIPSCTESASIWAGDYSKHMRHVGLFVRFSSYLAVSSGFEGFEVNLRSETSWVNALVTQQHI